MVGQVYIQRPLLTAGELARRTSSAFRSKYQSLVGRIGHKKAIIALAHQMIRTIYILFTRRQAYRDPGIDYQAMVVDRNAPRWIQALKKYGFWPASGANPTAATATAH